MTLSTVMLTGCQCLNYTVTGVCKVFLQENMENKIKKKKKSLLASILITGMKLPLPSMGTEFCNQCCQSPSGLTFLSHLNLTIESFLSGIPSATQFLLTCFQRQPLHLLSCPLLCSKQPLKSPFSLQWSTPSIKAITKPWSTSQSSEKKICQEAKAWKESIPNPFFNHTSHILKQYLWVWATDDCVFSVDKRNQLVWQLT